MALPTISTSDFTGLVKISTDPYRSAQLTQYITDTYEDTVRSIIGAEATNDIVNNTITTKWTDLFSGVYYYNIDEDKYYKTKGLTYALIRIIYFYYVRDNWISTNTGKVRNQNENANLLTPIEVNAIAENRYNNAVKAVNELKKWFDNYENFEGTIDSFVDNGGGSYTISSSNTIYLQNTDTVTISGDDYTVSNVVDNTSFDITAASAGLSFTGSYFYSPFDSVEFEKQDYIVF